MALINYGFTKRQLSMLISMISTEILIRWKSRPQEIDRQMYLCSCWPHKTSTKAIDSFICWANDVQVFPFQLLSLFDRNFHYGFSDDKLLTNIHKQTGFKFATNVSIDLKFPESGESQSAINYVFMTVYQVIFNGKWIYRWVYHYFRFDFHSNRILTLSTWWTVV